MIEGHGDDWYNYEGCIKTNFSSNIGNKVDLGALKEHLNGRMGDLLSVYPEPQPSTLEACLATRWHLRKEEVCVTNGATEAIYLAAKAFVGAKKTAILQPTFSEYADACRLHGHSIVSLYQLPKQGRLPADIQMLWLCNPNNPTGKVLDKAELAELVQRNPHICFVIDQSYEDFTLCPLFSPAEAVGMPNVLLLHSITKRYAVPGLRLGYLTGNAELLRRIRVCRMPWSVNALAIEAGLFLTRNSRDFPFDVQACLAQAQQLRQQLQALGGLEVWDTDTHFMLVRLRTGYASALKDFLMREHGLLIRDASNFEGLDRSFFRLASQSPEENKQLVQAISQWLKKEETWSIGG